jgi:peptidoglycan DL-endopeptidase RipA
LTTVTACAPGVGGRGWQHPASIIPVRCVRGAGRLGGSREGGLVSGRAAALAALVSGVLLAGLVLPAGAALAQPPPTDPGDEALGRSRAAVTARASEVGKLSGELAALDTRADDLQAELAVRHEDAEVALDNLETARAAAEEAARKADAARVETEAAGAAVEAARARLDAFVSATYQESLDTGPFGLLTAAESPADLVARAEFSDTIARSELTARDGLERARVARANADSTARAARAEAVARQGEAEVAKQASDAAVAAADAAAQANARELEQVATQRAAVQAKLDAAEATDAGLRAQRERFRAWQRQMAEEQAARERAARAGAAGRLGKPGRVTGSVQGVIDRALSQVGTRYVWGGGSGRGPTTGIGGARGTGFDCSGLMLYAYSGAGVALPRVSRSQFNAGRKVPISDLRPGDLVFFQRGGRPIHHVAMYIGGDQMVEAPYTGANVRVVPLRRAGLLPQATRLL